MKNIFLLFFFISSAQAIDTDTLEGLVVGHYDLIGKGVETKNTYYGSVLIDSHKSGLKVTRIINDKTIVGKAAIEKTRGEKIKVLRIRFTEKEKEYEETCLVNSDLDNYARLTCHLYLPSEQTKEPGLEAMFIKHED